MGLPGDFDALIRRTLAVTEIIGVDEAGRGPLAGPVVAAAVRLGPRPHPSLTPVRDSKLLSPAKRAVLFERIREAALGVSVGWAHPREIEATDILEATLSAMRRAVLRLRPEALVLVDGPRPIPGLGRRQLAVVDGDARSLAVACASVVAKVVRDRWMERLDRRYPGYGLALHKGYGTAAHEEALVRLGPSPAHRRTFAPVRRLAAR